MDHYTTLGISSDATTDEIKKAYRKLAQQHHPDKGGDAEAFQRISEAYSVLSDTDKRFQYDNPQNHGSFGFNLNDFFAQHFSHAFTNRGPAFNQMIQRTRVSISLKDAYYGAEHTLQLHTQQGTKVINIKVPVGANSGDQLRYDNVLDNGILIIDFVVQPDLRFDRHNDDLYMNYPVSVLDLITGAKINVTTISGKTLEVEIPAGCQPTQLIKITGHGMPNKQGGFGDQILLLKPHVPVNLTKELIDAINLYRTTTT